ncbi:hypothetical protein HMPREF9968_0949 [Streptococcus oralis SK255]|uniref:Uncharacterized protein n=1 Tax=Streptococcus oralis SK255 TaxID=1005704 RepID=F5VT96_STROR|nr:hypothetical protein HMPREF9968_0949 [Streptococcus oralis SK255]
MDFKLIKELDTVVDDAYDFYFGKEENKKVFFIKFLLQINFMIK